MKYPGCVSASMCLYTPAPHQQRLKIISSGWGEREREREIREKRERERK